MLDYKIAIVIEGERFEMPGLEKLDPKRSS